MNKVSVKLIDVVVDDIEVEDFSFYECMSCHWRFIGDAQRIMCGGNSQESTDLVKYCPMCGKKIEDVKII